MENPPSVATISSYSSADYCIYIYTRIFRVCSMFTRGNMFDFPHSPGSAPALKLRTSASAQLAGSCSRMDLFIEAPNKQGEVVDKQFDQGIWD